MVHAAARWRAAAPRTAPSALSGRKSCWFTNVLLFQMLFSPFFIHPTPTHSSAPNPHGHHPCPTLRNLPMCPPSHSAPTMSAQTPLPICFSEWEFYESKKSSSRFGPQCPVLEQTWISRSVSLPRAPRPPAKRCKVQILCWSLWALLLCCGAVAFMPLAWRGTDPDAVSGVAT